MKILSLKYIGRYVTTVLVVAAAYYVAGRLGFLMLMPPSQSAVIWPSAGIALAALLIKGKRYFPAVFIGAFGTSIYHYDVTALKEVLIASSIASGAAVQALVGSVLVRKLVKLPTAWEDAREGANVILVGGLVACLVNATWGNLVLYTAGIVNIDSIPMSAFTWWVGDVLGVLIFAPICLLVFSPTGKNLTVSKTRKMIVSTGLIMVLAAVIYVFMITKQYDERKKKEEFNKVSFDISMILQREINASLDILIANERFVSASEYVSAEEFQTFTRSFLQKEYGLYGLSWIPKIDRDSREVFVKSIREQGFEKFDIRRRFAMRRVGVSEKKPVYFPITYTEPYRQNIKAHGLDVYGVDPVVGDIRIRLLDHARDTGEVVATSMFPIVQAESQYGFIMYFPVYNQDVRGGSLEERRASLIGYCNGIFIFPHLMEAVRNAALEKNIDVVLYDTSNKLAEPQLLYDSRTADYKKPDVAIKVHDYQQLASKAYNVAGREWRLAFIKQAASSQQASWLVWCVFAGGIIFAGLINLFLFVITARTEVVQRLVDEKIKEIANSKAFLELMMSNNPDLIFVKDEDLRIVEANKAFLSTYPERKRDKVIGSLSTEGFSIEDSAEFTSLDRKAFRDGYSDVIEVIAFPDGQVRTLYTQKIRFENADGTAFILGIARDVTEREKLIKELSGTNAELEEFAYRTSHDLRSPLISAAKLLSMAEVSLENDNVDHVAKCIEHSRNSLNKLETLIDDILSLTEAKNAEEADVNICLSRIVEDAISKLENMDGFSEVSVMKDISFTDKITVKRNRLSLIVENMISNAVKYRDSNESSPYIKIAIYKKRGALVFSVEDNGLGVPKENQEDLFGMFKRFHPKVSYGSGLGLYMMRKSAGVLGGNIVFEQPKKGAVFKLTLPLR